LKALEQAAGVRIEADVIAGVNVHRVTPNELSDEHEDHLFIYIHGGAYVFGSGDASISEGIFIASTGASQHLLSTTACRQSTLSPLHSMMSSLYIGK
jgi:hypothetical protein